MKRSAGVTFVAIIQFVAAGFALLFAVLMGAAMVAVPQSDTQGRQAFLVGGILAGGLCAIMGVYGIASGIGLLRLRRWGRALTLVWGGLWLFFGVITAAMLLVIPLPPTPNADPVIMSAVRWGVSGFYAFLAAIGAWWVVLFTRSAIKSQFGTNGTVTAGDGRPLSIKVIAWLLLAGIPMLLVVVALGFPAAFMGVLITGWKALAFYVIFVGINAYVGLGLLRFDPAARKIAIGYFAFGIVNNLFWLARPGFGDRYAAMVRLYPTWLQNLQGAQSAVDPKLIAASIAFGVVIAIVPIWLLVTRAAFFGPRVSSTTSTPTPS